MNMGGFKTIELMIFPSAFAKTGICAGVDDRELLPVFESST
jgi:hypothetical protein